ncbi:MAG: hypothetical protein WCJ81_00380 [bacterium]
MGKDWFFACGIAVFGGVVTRGDGCVNVYLTYICEPFTMVDRIIPLLFVTAELILVACRSFNIV